MLKHAKFSPLDDQGPVNIATPEKNKNKRNILGAFLKEGNSN